MPPDCRNGICIPVLGCVFVAAFASIELQWHRKDAIPRSLKCTDRVHLLNGRLFLIDCVPDGRCFFHMLALHAADKDTLWKWASLPKRYSYPMLADGRSDDMAYSTVLDGAKQAAATALKSLESDPTLAETAARVRAGIVPEECDVAPILRAFDVALRVWWPNGQAEVINPEGKRMMDTFFSEFVQLDGARRGHYSLALPAHSATGAPHPSVVTHAISVCDVDMALLMVSGLKKFENRKFRMSGWYALHVSRTEATEVVRNLLGSAGVQAQLNALPPARFRGGDLCGLICITGSTEPTYCDGDPWALGPVCNIIVDFIKLPHGIWVHQGQIGTWPIDAGTLAELQLALAASRVAPGTLGAQHI